LTPDQRQALDLQSQGYSRAQIAAQMGISEHAVKRRLAGARKWMDADPQVSKTAQEFGMADITQLDHYWRRYPTPDGGFVTGHFVNAAASKDRDILADISDAFKDIPPWVPVYLTPRNDDLMTVYPLVDAHFGMKAWGRETGGQDYDLRLAEKDIKAAFSALWDETPQSDHAVLILGGDTLHSDDNQGHTQSRAHVVDTDGRLYKTSDVAIEAICWVIEGLAHRHHKVTVRVLRGNHDPHAHLILHFALASRYRMSDNITIEDAARDLYWIRHGRSLVAAHHGDKGGAQRLSMVLADTCPEWSLARDRHILTGHVHHDSIKDYPGVKWWSLRAFCPPDEYGSSFGSRRALQSLTFCAKRGLKRHAIEGIYRDQ
jgi:hypothetical protein